MGTLDAAQLSDASPKRSVLASSVVTHRSNTTPTRTRHGEQVAIPRGLGCIASHGTVRAVVVDELFKVGKEVRMRRFLPAN
jgi:hypothetical protein